MSLEQRSVVPSQRIRVLPIPDTAPPLVPAPEFEQPTVSRFVQGTLAVEFDPEHSSAYFGPQPTSTHELPDAHEWASRMAQALVEVMTGARPAPQVIRWTAPEVYSTVARRAALAARRGMTPSRRAVVRKVRVCQPADGVVEACAVIVDSGRVRAMALRMTGLDHRWMVTELQLG